MSCSHLRANILYILRCVITPFIKLIPKKNNLVVFTSWFGEKYIDNTKYLYEYLLLDSKYDVYWLTKNKDVYALLKEKKHPVVMFSSLRALYLQLRARACFSTVQFSDFNTWLVCNTIYIDLGHGNMIKDPGSILVNKHSQRVQNYLLNNLKYYAIVPSTFAKHYYKQIVPVNDNNIFISDFARNDVFIDAQLRKDKNTIVEAIGKGKRRILYMPTHRSDGKVRFDLEQILPLDLIESLCLKTDSVFIVKKHFYHRNEQVDLSKYSCIFDITNEDSIDPQVLLYQADLLVTDYSSCFIDYLLLHRPIIFFQFDYNYYVNKERSLFIDFKEENFAPVTYTKNDFVSSLSKVLECGFSEYKDNYDRIVSMFFDNPYQSGGRAKDKDILDALLTGQK